MKVVLECYKMDIAWLELRNYKKSSTQSKKFQFWNCRAFLLAMQMTKKRCNIKTRIFLDNVEPFLCCRWSKKDREHCSSKVPNEGLLLLLFFAWRSKLAFEEVWKKNWSRGGPIFFSFFLENGRISVILLRFKMLFCFNKVGIYRL